MAEPTREAHASSAIAVDPEKKWKLFGLDTGNWISLTALVLSVGTVMWQVTGYLRGAQVEFLPPTSVTFRFWSAGPANSVALSATTMNYLNQGRKDYDGLVLDEHAEIGLSASAAPTRLDWWWFLGPTGDPT